MKRYFDFFVVAIATVIGMGLFAACGVDDDTPNTGPSTEITKGTFYFCYGVPESELDVAYFKFKFTFLDEKGNEKSEEIVATKEAFSASNPDPTLQSETDLRFYKQAVRISSLPSSVRCEPQIVIKGSEELDKDKYDVGQTIFVYFQPDGSQYAQTCSTGSMKRYKGVPKDKLQEILGSFQKSAKKTFLIQKTGAVSLYE